MTTLKDKALCKPATHDISDLTPCNHEEADVRLLLHLAHAVSMGHLHVFIRTNDTDVVVLAVAAYARLEDVLSDIVVGFGVGDKRRGRSMK